MKTDISPEERRQRRGKTAVFAGYLVIYGTVKEMFKFRMTACDTCEGILHANTGLRYSAKRNETKRND